jgi:hypothetical protein
VLERIAAEIDREAGVIGFPNKLAVCKICQDIKVSEGKAATAAICIDDRAESTAIDRRPIVADEIACNIVRRQRAPGGSERMTNKSSEKS